jgi:hypothetical protein
MIRPSSHLAVLMALLTLPAPAAFAHGAFCNCVALDAEQVRCHGGFIGGGPAPGVTLDVIGYDQTIHLQGKLDADSTLTFKRPAGEFYVLLDGGPGYMAEVDHSEIAER